MSPQKARFVELLEELFQLNQPELDFGLYRIVHARSKEIRAFMQTELATEIDAAFAGQATQTAGQALQSARQKVLDNLADDAFDTAGELKPQHHATKLGKDYRAAQQQARDGGGPLAGDAQVYDHLYRFFSRYYDKGDFLSKRYFVAENDQRALPYAVPYDGREVLLHWANKDQYYIKSSEAFSNYTFDLTQALRKETERQKGTPGLDFGPDTNVTPLKVHLRLAAAAEGEHNNVKDSQERFFLIHPAMPVLLETTRNGAPELVIQFEYRPDHGKTGQAGTWQQKLLAEAEAAVLQALGTLPQAQAFARGLAVQAPTDKRPERTLLAKYLGQFTDRNTMDYFIHKNLGGFLRRELDFYIKNEIMRLDDIESAEAPRVEVYLAKLRVLRRIAKRIIDFLAQLEDFQKKLWLKKKFVVDTQYIVTLDKIPTSLYEEIVKCDAQRDEWVKLHDIAKIVADTTTPGFSAPITLEFLRANQFLPIDTKFFSEIFKCSLTESFQGVDHNLDGLLINADNFQAVSLIGNRYCGEIDVAYLDPPYNTDAGPIDYKNGYRNSSWIAMMSDRLINLKPLLANAGVVCITIDDYQVHELATLLDNEFGKDLHLGTSIIRNNPSGRSTVKGLSICHEYAFFYGASEESGLKRLPRTEKQLDRFSIEDGLHVDWRNFRKDGGAVTHRAERPKQFYPIFVNSESLSLRIPKMDWDATQKTWLSAETPDSNEIIIYPVDEKGRDRVWSFNHISAKENISDLEVRIVRANQLQIFRKHLPSDGVLPRSWWDKNTYAAREYGSATLSQLFGSASFSFAKSPFAVQDCLWVAGLDDESIGYVIDYFGGSGTTAHATISLNRQDGGRRKFILIEQGRYFDDVLGARIKKITYSPDWKNGHPVSRNGSSQVIKYLRLESFEDTLNNLELTDQSLLAPPPTQDQPAKNMARDYTLHYWLNVETANSPSLLNVREFADPTAYKLKIKQPGSDVQVEKAVDLVETFNWLIGLHVALLDRPRTYAVTFERQPDPDLPDDQFTRWQATSIKEAEDGLFWFRRVDGHVLSVPGDELSRERVLVVWRKLSGDAGRDQAALEAWLAKLQINLRETEYATIYLNGSHALPSDGSAGARVRLIEEAFAQRMWEDT